MATFLFVRQPGQEVAGPLQPAEAIPGPLMTSTEEEGSAASSEGSDAPAAASSTSGASSASSVSSVSSASSAGEGENVMTSGVPSWAAAQVRWPAWKCVLHAVGL